jgi:2-C-methyl-D-erythritol 2,4-cyclodiphosphate synthase
MRIGIGYDVHRLTEGRKLVLGGVVIPFEKGLLGHSDADVLVHAVCDALLGAAGLGDIGMHFPDTDPEYKDISSIKILAKTYELVSSKNFKMQKNIARTIEIEPECVNVKATTFEGLGMIGKGEGIGAMCVVLIQSLKKNE